MSFINDRFLGKNSFDNEHPSVLDIIKYKGTHLKYKEYFDSLTKLTVGEQSVGTPDGTVAIRFDDYFKGGETLYDPAANNKLFVDAQRNYVRLCSDVAAATFLTPPGLINWDLTGYKCVVFPIRDTGDAQIVTVRLYSGADYIEHTLTLNGVAGEYHNLLVDLLNDPTTGPFDPSAVDAIEFVGVNPGECFEVAMAYPIFTLSEIIGSRSSLKLTCIENFDFTRNLEVDEVKCGNVTVCKVATDDSIDLTVTVKEYGPELFALGGSTTVTKGSTYLPTTGNKVVPGQQQVTFAPGTIIDQFIKPDGGCVSPVCITEDLDVSKLGTNDFYYDEVTGIVTFGDADLDGVELTPCIKEEVTADCIEVKALELGYNGRLVVQRKTKNGRIWSYEFTNVQIESTDFSGFDDTGDDVDINLSATADNDGVLYRVYVQ